MSDSLRDQLLKLGLASAKDARRTRNDAAREKRSRPPANRKSTAAPALTSSPAQSAKAERDRALNRQREADAQARARWAEVRQIVEAHRVPKAEGYDYFHFVDRGKVRRVAVNPELRTRLLDGSLAVVRCEGRYDLVPAEAAERIRAREPRAFVTLSTEDAPPGEDDTSRE